MTPTLYQQNKPSCLLPVCKKNVLYLKKTKKTTQTTKQPQEILHCLNT